MQKSNIHYIKESAMSVPARSSPRNWGMGTYQEGIGHSIHQPLITGIAAGVLGIPRHVPVQGLQVGQDLVHVGGITPQHKN